MTDPAPAFEVREVVEHRCMRWRVVRREFKLLVQGAQWVYGLREIVPEGKGAVYLYDVPETVIRAESVVDRLARLSE
jgi:hypothetical protein